MSEKSTVAISRCACGQVELEARGRPIISVVCYCDDCQAAAREIEALPGARPVLDHDGGTGFITYRRDRVRPVKGGHLLKPLKLKTGSPTSRFVATCCNSAMYLGFDDSKHWVPVYRDRFQGSVRPVEMRICTRFRPDGASLPTDAPSYPGYAFGFMLRLIGARLAMMFG